MERAKVGRGGWSSAFKVVMLALLAGATNFACDGIIEVHGRVFQAVEPEKGASSYALVDKAGQVLPERLVPVDGAEITVVPWRPEEQSKIENPELQTFRAVSNDTGEFSLKRMTAPCKFDATLTVRRTGYQTAQTIFLHEGVPHYVIVVLAREPDR